MQIKREYDKSSSPYIWDVVVSFIKRNRQFKSVTGIKYIAEATTSSINYKGGRENSNRATIGESINKKQFIYYHILSFIIHLNIFHLQK